MRSPAWALLALPLALALADSACGRGRSRGRSGPGATGGMRPPATFTATHVGVGSNHVCASTFDGRVWCWGRDNGYGQLGDGTSEAHGDPRVVPGLGGAVDVVAGYQHACALLGQGEVRCWGENQDGQLGDGLRRGRSSPVDVAGLPPARALFAGPVTTCAEDRSGAVWCWGRLPATGSEPDAWGGSYPEPRPRRVAGLPAGPLVAMSVGFSHVCAIAGDRALRCWGSGFLGEMGDGTGRSRVSADLVPGLAAATAAAAGESFSCAIASGGLSCWGYGTTSGGAWSPGAAGCDRNPCVVASSSPLVSLAAGRSLCAITAAGAVQCLGTAGVVPSGAPTTWLGPTLTTIPLGVHAVALSLGPTYGCALADTGALACFDFVEPPHTGGPAPTHPR